MGYETSPVRVAGCLGRLLTQSGILASHMSSLFLILILGANRTVPSTFSCSRVIARIHYNENHPKVDHWLTARRRRQVFTHMFYALSLESLYPHPTPQVRA